MDSSAIKQALNNILFCEHDINRMQVSVDTLYNQLSHATGVFLDEMTTESMHHTAHGMVISPLQAAHCLTDTIRTTKFLRAIHQAIEDQLTENKCINILYAGCGPYATLLIPFTSWYTPQQIQFTLLEIDEWSHKTVTELFAHNNLNEYITDIILTDATDQTLQFEEQFELIVSETMQAGLKSECQVPITRNLVQFLSSNGIFIPERIQLDLCLSDHFQISHLADLQHLGTVYDYNYNDLPHKEKESTVTLPASPKPFLQLLTEIHLYKNIKIAHFESGLTTPLVITQLPENIQKIHSSYIEDSNPHLNFEYE